MDRPLCQQNERLMPNLIRYDCRASRVRNAAMTFGVRSLLVILLLLPLGSGVAQAQLRGHGGPVRALVVSPDGRHAVSGSFDTSAIRWSLTRNVAEQVMRFHDNAVNAVVWLKDGRIEIGRAHV